MLIVLNLWRWVPLAVLLLLAPAGSVLFPAHATLFPQPTSAARAADGLVSGTSSPTPQPGSTPRTGFTAQLSATPTPQSSAQGWLEYRADAHNDGLQRAGVIGKYYKQTWSARLSSARVPLPLYSTPLLGGDGTLYQVDDAGRLNALDPGSGAVRWRSSPVLGVPDLGRPRDRGTDPAIGPNGAVYAGQDGPSGAEGGGIYRFSATDHQGTRFFSSGHYQGNSVTIGRDGMVYAASIEGMIYAVAASGAARYAYALQQQCPAGTTAFSQSTPALDLQGNLYLGFGCSGAVEQGGLLRLGPSGVARWTFFYRVPAALGSGPGGAIIGAVALSADEQTAYAVDSQQNVFAVATQTGALRWVYTAPSAIAGAPALSPAGDLLYIGVQERGLTALSTATGQVLASAGDTNLNVASPCVDQAGNVLEGYADGALAAYLPRLQGTMFALQARLRSGNAALIYGGPILGPDGAIYAGTSDGSLVAFRPAASLPLPTVTSTPLATSTPPAAVALRVIARLGLRTAYPGDVQTVDLRTEPGARLVLTVAYGKGQSLIYRAIADYYGTAQIRFPVRFTPSRSAGMMQAQIGVDATAAGRRVHRTFRFSVQRRDLIARLSIVRLHLRAPFVPANGTQVLDIAAARGTSLICTVTYNGILDPVAFALSADGSGYATLRFVVRFQPLRGTRVPAYVTVTAEQGARLRVASIRFFVGKS